MSGGCQPLNSVRQESDFRGGVPAFLMLHKNDNIPCQENNLTDSPSDTYPFDRN